VISSLSNSIQVIDIETWTVVREYNVGDGCNPYLGALTSDRLLLITCSQSNELILVDPEVAMEAEAVLKRMDMPSGDQLFPFDPTTPGAAWPQGVAVVGHMAYVTLANLDAMWAPAGPGVVLVVDVAAWTQDKLIQLSKTNPAAIHRPITGGDKLYVTCPGPYPFDGTGIVEVLDTSSDEVIDTIAVGGAPGRMWVDADGDCWIGDMNAGNVLGFNTTNSQVVDPISLCPTEGDFVSDLATDGRGNLYACCFGTDAVHIFPKDDSSNARVVEVGDGPVAIQVVQR
jgi:DNA-binding beta-propeller fold protein YncE